MDTLEVLSAVLGIAATVQLLAGYRLTHRSARHDRET